MSIYIKEQNFTNNRYILYARKSTESEDRQVASIQDQIDVMTEVAKELKLNIVETMTESSSGFKIGRKVFNEMASKIEDGQADGVVVWKLSRLARNPDDAGRIMGLLQRKQIKHIRTADRDWLPDDNVTMMYVEFAFTNQFSRDLSVDTTRGLNKKALRGWCPKSILPLGYMHSPYKKLGEHEIIPDPERFDIVTKVLKMVASRELSMPQAYQFAYDNGLRTKDGKKLSKSVFYHLLYEPFYFGKFEYPLHSGNWFEGKHEKAITYEEHELILKNRGRKNNPRPQKHLFPFTGMMKCGECGCSIVIDPKVKVLKDGTTQNYNYYRCTKKKSKCSQKYLESKELGKQLLDLISSIEIPEVFHEWAIEELKKEQQKEITSRNEIVEISRGKYDEITQKIDELVKGWLDKKVPEGAYKRNLELLEKDQSKYKSLLDNSHERTKEWIKKAENVFNFANDAKFVFEHGGLTEKNNILMNLGANIVIKDLKINLEIDKPLIILRESKPFLEKAIPRFEPEKSLVNKENMKVYMSQSTEWGS